MIRRSKMKIIRCKSCGNILEVLYDSKVTPTCCGKEMEEVIANTEDGAIEKHVPFVTVENSVLNVKIGEVEHPSIDSHYIMFIIVVMGDKVIRKNLVAGETPEATFEIGDYEGTIEVYEYCNLHGLYKKEITV